jgi:transcription initiation factor TFIIA small subunit
MNFMQTLSFVALQLGQITPQLALKVLLQFDKSINVALSQRLKNKVTFKVSNNDNYSVMLQVPVVHLVL